LFNRTGKISKILAKAKQQLELNKLLAHTEIVLAQVKAYQQAFYKFLNPITGEIDVDVSRFNFFELCREWRLVGKEASLFRVSPAQRELEVELAMTPEMQKLKSRERELEREFFASRGKAL
jgi:hypothetical protein